MESENTPALKLYARLGYKEAWRDPTAKAAKVAARPPARPPAWRRRCARRGAQRADGAGSSAPSPRAKKKT